MKKLSVISADRVPTDELLLAIALQEANGRKLGPTMGEFFLDDEGDPVRWDSPKLRWCCAVGALILAGEGIFVPSEDGEVIAVQGLPRPLDVDSISAGNDDSSPNYSEDEDDKGETLGHAFQLAMDGYGGPSWTVDLTLPLAHGHRARSAVEACAR